jgi:hypothetical protein
LTTLDEKKGETSHTRPQFLPDGRNVLFTVTLSDASAGGPQFAVMDTAAGTYRTVARGGTNGRYVRSGHLVYVRGTTLMAVPFDAATLSVTGPEAPVVEGVSTLGPPGTGDYAVSDDGLLAYFVGSSTGNATTLAWADRQGKTTVLPGQATGLWGTGRLSRMACRQRHLEQQGWTRHLDFRRRAAHRRGHVRRVTGFPVWTKDSARIYFSSTRDGSTAVSRADRRQRKSGAVSGDDEPADAGIGRA